MPHCRSARYGPEALPVALAAGVGVEASLLRRVAVVRPSSRRQGAGLYAAARRKVPSWTPRGVSSWVSSCDAFVGGRGFPRQDSGASRRWGSRGRNRSDPRRAQHLSPGQPPPLRAVRKGRPAAGPRLPQVRQEAADEPALGAARPRGRVPRRALRRRDDQPAAALRDRPRARERRHRGLVAATVAVAARDPSIPALSAAELWALYNIDDAKADARFKNKPVAITGTVADVRRDFHGDVMLRLATGETLETVRASIINHDDSGRTIPVRGQLVSLRCRGGGKLIGSPELEACLARSRLRAAGRGAYLASPVFSASCFPGDLELRAVGEGHRGRRVGGVEGDVAARRALLEDGVGRDVGRHARVDVPQLGERPHPDVREGARVAELGLEVAILVELRGRARSVGQRQVHERVVAPREDLVARALEERVVLALHQLRPAPEVERAAREGQVVDAVDHDGVRVPPGVELAARAPHHGDAREVEALGEDRAVGVEPVLLDGLERVRVQEDPRVAQHLVARHRAPQDEARREVHVLRRRLLVVPVVVLRGPVRPAVPRVGVHVAQEREARVVAHGVGGVLDEHLDERRPPFRPGGVVARDGGGRLHEVAVVEVVIVERGVRVVARRHAHERGPRLVVIEQLGRLAVEPVLQLVLERAQHEVVVLLVADGVGQLHDRRDASERLACPVRVAIGLRLQPHGEEVGRPRHLAHVLRHEQLRSTLSTTGMTGRTPPKVSLVSNAWPAKSFMAPRGLAYS